MVKIIIFIVLRVNRNLKGHSILNDEFYGMYHLSSNFMMTLRLGEGRVCVTLSNFIWLIKAHKCDQSNIRKDSSCTSDQCIEDMHLPSKELMSWALHT